ncbi:MAG: DUF393 domain-containing protein [Deltaproteobacteria bacterium]|nr:DUF393 domain-containing protein [Deltaproteobacteria bacterium]
MAQRIVLYDGVCGFCNGLVQWLLRVDREGAFQFAALQGSTAAELRARHPEIPVELDTMVYVEEGTVYLRSRALFAAARHLPAPWSWSRFLALLPLVFTDAGYRLVAAVRYRIWGRLEACQVPSAEQRARFLA